MKVEGYIAQMSEKAIPEAEEIASMDGVEALQKAANGFFGREVGGSGRGLSPATAMLSCKI